MSNQVPLTPPSGFENSRPRQESPPTALVATSRDWLTAHGRYKRRRGSSTQVNGVVEAKWGAKCRRMVSLVSRSLANNYPTWLALFVNEATKMAQLAFRSTNGTPATRVLGDDFGVYSYGWPTTRLDRTPTFRAMPHVYDNEHGGMTIARLSYEKARRFMCGGSRSLLRQDANTAWGGYTSAPGKWGNRFNDSDSVGDEPTEVTPLGMVPPLQMPTVIAGNDLGTSEIGPWRGSDAFFYSVLFENESGELSRYPIPRPPNSVAIGYVGFGYCQVSSAHPTHYFDSVVFSGIAIGPPGTVRRRLVRSTKVSIDSSALSPFPAAGELFFCARIDNNTDTTYTLREGNDLALDTSPIPQELVKLIWPKRARYAGRFDGHAVLGDLRPNPYALLVAPWDNGSVNAPIDDSSLYTGDDHSVAVTPTQVLLRKVSSGVVKETPYDIGSLTLEGIVDAVSVNQTYATITRSCTYLKGSSLLTYTPVDGDVFAGDTVVSSDWEAGTKVVSVTSVGIYQYVYVNTAAINGALHVNVDFKHGAVDTTNPAPWAVGVVPGADALAPAEALLRTKVDTTATWAAGDLSFILTGGAANANLPYISPGMLVYEVAKFADYTEVTGVDETTGTITISTAAVSSSAGAEAITFAYDTGDIARFESLQAVRAASEFLYIPNAIGAPWTALTKLGGVMTKWKDASDATGYSVELTVPVTPDPAYVATAQMGMDPISAPPLRIDYMRVTIRAKVVSSIGTTKAYVYPFVGTDDLSLGPDTYPTASELTGAFADYQFDLPYYPGAGGWFSGIAWTVANVNAGPWGVDIRFVPGGAGDVISVFVSEFKVEVIGPGLTKYPGYIRTYGNAFPVALPFNKAYLDKFEPQPQTVMFSVASPGYAQNGINTYFVGNQRSGPADFGPMVGLADMGPVLLVFYAHGICRLWNPRTGLTHADDDYMLTPINWTRGAITPYLICSGNGWAFFVSEEGVFGTGINPMVSPYTGGVISQDMGEALLSKALYDTQRDPGKRGELEYAINKCIAAVASGSDDYAISGYVEAGILYLNYDADATTKRQLRYDFSAGIGRQGLDEIIAGRDQSGQPVPWPWSAPLTLATSAGCRVAESDGMHHYAALDENLGATDGRVDEIDVGTDDNGTPVRAIGYTGMEWAEGLNKLQPRRARGVMTKPGTGLSVSVTRTPELNPDDCAWDTLAASGSGTADFGRFVMWIKDGAAGDIRDALAVRIMDDGTGACPDVSKLYIDVDEVQFMKPEGGA